MVTTTNTLHVGQLIKTYIDTKRIAKSAVARKIGKADNDMLRYQKSVSLKSEVLLMLSHALQHNFFADIAALLPAHYTTDAPVDVLNAERIAALEQQVKILQAEKAVLLEAMRK
jgi:hypothetical protein